MKDNGERYFIYCGIFYYNPFEKGKVLGIESFALETGSLICVLDLRTRVQGNTRLYRWFGTKREANKIIKLMAKERSSENNEKIISLWREGVELWNIMKDKIIIRATAEKNIEEMILGD